MTLETCRGTKLYVICIKIVYQVGIIKGIILRCTAYQISRFTRSEFCLMTSPALRGYFATCSDNSLSTCRDNLFALSSRVENQKLGRIICPETSVRKYALHAAYTPQKSAGPIRKAEITHVWWLTLRVMRCSYRKTLWIDECLFDDCLFDDCLFDDRLFGDRLFDDSLFDDRLFEDRLSDDCFPLIQTVRIPHNCNTAFSSHSSSNFNLSK